MRKLDRREALREAVRLQLAQSKPLLGREVWWNGLFQSVPAQSTDLHAPLHSNITTARQELDKKEQWLGSITEREEARLRRGINSIMADIDAQGASHWQVIFADASAKVLNCWGSGARFWYTDIFHSELGARSSSICAPDVCSQQDILLKIMPDYFTRMSGRQDLTRNHMQTAREVSHWADVPLDFVVIGLDGCGSTSVRRNLDKHPDVNFTALSVYNADEDFFLMEMGRQTLPFMDQVEKFAAHRERLARKGRQFKLGLYCPSIWSEPIMRQSLLYIPDIKVVATLCDPVDRFERKLHLEYLPTPETLATDFKKLLADESGYLYFGDRIRSWANDFADNLFLLEKDSVSDRRTMERLASFLGLRPFPSTVHFERYNSRGGARTLACSERTTVDQLKLFFEPEYKAVEDLLGEVSERLRLRKTRCDELHVEGTEGTHNMKYVIPNSVWDSESERQR
eukprot:CAMPEP_0197663814 /NCGR_PEP_ID=MMETSP1338-20131121/58257_1 /TAXON_ID=43686 ORGANISM="Pelagodinium beii, Strain RCC1491" /NCGR_SAMPLE_ID=MMETSP1338 /ASSEMBLY_ACC=CAM_ASM_000754 /LENGTH=455 /DNA_ID=CAMNT_0043242319 /DNA_START=153 /DNA_END=1521 /DNA_ORIENTATION=-